MTFRSKIKYTIGTYQNERFIESHKWFSTCEMEVSVPYSVCSQITGKEFYEEHRRKVRERLRKLCEWKGAERIEGEGCSDHVQIFVRSPQKKERFGVHGISEMEERDEHISEMGKYEIRVPNPRILAQGSYADTVGKKSKAIQGYVAN